MCTNGATRTGTATCDYAGHLQQLCQGGQWADTLVCLESSADDAQLIAGEAAQTLFGQCLGTALTPAEIIQHFPDGAARWTPDNLLRAAEETITLTAYNRRCNQLTGCEQWWSISGSGDVFNIGYQLDPNGNLSLFQAIGQPPGHGQLVLPGAGGITLATLSTDDLNFAYPRRFLVKVTDTCFSVSSLVQRYPPDVNGQWMESVRFASTQWTWPVTARPTPAPVPTIAIDTCPPATTTVPAIAAAWIAPGRTQTYVNNGWTLSDERNCTPLTSCDAWRPTTQNTGAQYLTIVGTTLKLDLVGGPVTLAADGTFANAKVHGHLTPTCGHFWYQDSIPNSGGMAGTKELAYETIVQHP